VTADDARRKRRVLGGMILVLALVAVRLPLLDGPITGWHGWRQADTTAIARNFVEEDMNILHPRVDWRGATSGAVECEFPLVSWVIAGAWRLGVDENVGARLPAMLASVLGTFGVLVLLRGWGLERVGWIAACAYGFSPFVVYFGRTPTPETAMLAASVWGLAFADRWAVTGRVRWLVGAASCLALAALLKLPALYMGLPLVVLLHERCGWSVFRSAAPWIAAAFLLVVVGAWYAHANAWGGSSGLTFGIWGAGTDKLLRVDLLGSWGFYNAVLMVSLVERVLTYAGAISAVIGLAVMPHGLPFRVVVSWFAALLVYLVVASGGVFAHDYYLMPFVPPAAIAMGFAWNWGFRSDRRRAVRAFHGLLVVAAIVLSADRVIQFLRKEDPESALLRVAAQVSELSQPSDRIVVVHDGDPRLLYHAGRKGWHMPPDRLAGWMDRTGDHDARLIVIDTRSLSEDAFSAVAGDSGWRPVASVETYRIHAR